MTKFSREAFEALGYLSRTSERTQAVIGFQDSMYNLVVRQAVTKSNNVALNYQELLTPVHELLKDPRVLGVKLMGAAILQYPGRFSDLLLLNDRKVVTYRLEDESGSLGVREYLKESQRRVGLSTLRLPQDTLVQSAVRFTTQDQEGIWPSGADNIDVERVNRHFDAVYQFGC